jgi:flagellar basal-body rod protein FlgB
MMFIEGLVNQGNIPLLERMLEFTAARHRLIAENVVNISTPGHQQKDLSAEKFQQVLRDRLARRSRGPMGARAFDDIRLEVDRPSGGILFHDGANRSAEQLMSDQARNAMMHNLAVELLRRQYEQLKSALRERVA